LWFPSQIRGKRCSIWGFSKVLVVFLVEFLDSSWFSKFWWTKSWLWDAHEVLLLSPKSCANPEIGGFEEKGLSLGFIAQIIFSSGEGLILLDLLGEIL
jgi:hypothetical protein